MSIQEIIDGSLQIIGKILAIGNWEKGLTKVEHRGILKKYLKNICLIILAIFSSRVIFILFFVDL